MDRYEAVKRIKDHMSIHHIGEYPHIKLGEAMEMAIHALYDYDRLATACRELTLRLEVEQKRNAKLRKDLEAGLLVELPLVAMVEQSLQGGEMKPDKDQRFNGRYAVVYSDKKKWGAPLIDICGGYYNPDEAEERKKALMELMKEGG